MKRKLQLPIQMNYIKLIGLQNKNIGMLHSLMIQWRSLYQKHIFKNSHGIPKFHIDSLFPDIDIYISIQKPEDPT